MKKGAFYWIGLSDLMTSLFFVMLVLYGITFAALTFEKNKLVTEVEKFEEIKRVETALSTLDPNYYSFNPMNKRFKLKIDAKFRSNSSDIMALPAHTRDSLLNAGRSLYDKIDSLTKSHKDIEYLIVIEGNTERYDNNHLKIPDEGYQLSYRRALALFNFWKQNQINFYNLNEQCEVMIAGSGYFGQSRESNESKNKRFSIQVTSKVGQFLSKQTSSD